MTATRSLAPKAGRVLALIGLVAAAVTAPAAAAEAATATATAGATAKTTAIATATATATATPTPPKPVPTPPPGIPTRVQVPKPHRTGSRTVIPYGPNWSVTLTSNCPSPLWATQYCTLTATANGDVGPTPWYIQIWDYNTNTLIADCGSGTTCSVSVVSNVETYQDYVAYIGTCCGDPPANEQATSSLSVQWQSVGWVSLTAPTTTRPVGGSVTLTASTITDVGPTPFYIQLWDLTADTLLVSCGSGTSCPVTVSQAAATTHAYVATTAPWGTAYPPANRQAVSEGMWVTWSTTAGTLAGWNISVSAPEDVYGAETVTATANADVGPTPYDIVIYDESVPGSGTLLKACGIGAGCSVTITPTTGTHYYVAFVAAYSATLPPVNAQAAAYPVVSYEHS